MFDLTTKRQRTRVVAYTAEGDCLNLPVTRLKPDQRGRWSLISGSAARASLQPDHRVDHNLCYIISLLHAY